MNDRMKLQKRVNIACAVSYARELANRKDWPTVVCHEPNGVKVWVILALEKLPEGAELLVIVNPAECPVTELPEDCV